MRFDALGSRVALTYAAVIVLIGVIPLVLMVAMLGLEQPLDLTLLAMLAVASSLATTLSVVIALLGVKKLIAIYARALSRMVGAFPVTSTALRRERKAAARAAATALAKPSSPQSVARLPASRGRIRTQSVEKKCPRCGKVLPFGDVHVICPFCGHRLK